MTYFFDNHLEFVTEDVRKIRPVTTVTPESLDKRCSVLLPKWMIEGKTILDLGSCLGAFGHWALANGAKHYTGVEVQQAFCLKSENLLGKYWDSSNFKILNSDIVQFLSNCTEKYDIVVACGVIHGTVNVISTLQQITNISSNYVVIESLDVPEPTTPAIIFKAHSMTSKYALYPYSGWTPLIGYTALQYVMHEYDFVIDGERIYPERITESHDAYNDSVDNTKYSDAEFSTIAIPSRYMVRYKKQKTTKTSLENKIRQKVVLQRSVVSTENFKTKKPDVWKFDDAVAKRFQEEAKNNIPDYERVINMCLELANRKYNKECRVVDVGSALGHTMDKFISAGYTNTIGIEYSQDMMNNSSHSDKVILSDVWPTEIQADFVMANWTLHFVVERKDYLQNIYDSLSEGGTLIVSDKTAQTELIKELYYDFKRTNGVSNEYIYEKEQKLKGFMFPYTAEWYTDTLKDVGFKNIQVINAKLGFVTFYCEK
jgi:SAM-dependent methyltransferase